MDVSPDMVVHRVGGATLDNLRISPVDLRQHPPGCSVLLGGTPQEAAERLRQTYRRSKKWGRRAHDVGSTTIAAIRTAGFDVIPEPTTNFPNHARVIHPGGAVGFTDERLVELAAQFTLTKGC